MLRKLLIVATVVLALSLASMFLPARQMNIEGIGRLSFETKITLSVGSEVAYAAPDIITNSPTANLGGWTNPANAYTDDANYASIMSGTPSASHTYYNYGFNLSDNTINQVRVRYDAWCAVAGITYIGSASSVGNNPTSGSFSLPGGWVAGDTAIFWWYTYANTKTFTAPSGVTQKQQASSPGYGRLYIGYRVLQSGDSTFPWSASSVGNSTTIWGTSVFRGVDSAGDPFEAQSGAPATFTNARNPNPPPVTTVSNNAWVIPIFGKDNDYTSITAPANYTSAGSNSSRFGSDASAGVAYRQIATPGAEDPGAWTLSGGAASDDGYVWTGVLKPEGYSEQIRVDVSWDGGTSWSSRQVTTLTGSEATYWYDVTSATSWTPAKLSDANFRVRVDAYTQGTAGEVRLDWIPVEVNYTPPGAPCWLCGWGKRVRLIIDHNDITAPLSNFPVLLYLSTSSGRGGDDVSFVFSEVGSNSKKIAVTTSDCAECYVEIEKWDQANQRAWLWVKVPSISNTADTDLYLYYDNTHADNNAYVGDTDSTPAENVWDSNFAMVQHLGEDSTVVHDSTLNNNDETNPPPAPPSPGYYRASYNNAGEINGCYSFSDNGTNGTRLQMADSTSLDITDNITLEAFIYLNDTTDAKFIVKDDPLDIGGSGCYNLQQELRGVNPNLELQLDLGGWARVSYDTYNTGEWLYLVGTYDRQTMRLYLNGTERATNPQTAAIRSSNIVNLALGNRAEDVGTLYDLHGLLDEARISNTARSAAWVRASYESGIDDLIDFGAEETFPADIVNTPSAINFGLVAENSPYWSSGSAPTFPLSDNQCLFTLTNNSSCPLNVSIRATNFICGGDNWTLVLGVPGANEARMKAGRSGDAAEGNMLILTTGDQSFISSIGVSASKKWEIKLETGTFTDTLQKTSIITLTAISA